MVVKNCLAFQNKAKGFDQNSNTGSISFLNCTSYNNGIGTPGGHFNYSVSAPLAIGNTLTVINCISLGSNGVDLLNPNLVTNSWDDHSVFPTALTTASPADFVSLDTTGVRGLRQHDGSLPVLDFMHLAAGSQFIDAGTNIGLLYYGLKPDLGCFESSLITSVQEKSVVEVPKAFQLFQNFPNPFNPSTEIRFTVAKSSNVKLHVFNILGQQVATLFSGHAEPGRMYTLQFEISSLSSGVYFSVLEGTGERQIRKMVLMK
jgi:hypothetical protein